MLRLLMLAALFCQEASTGKVELRVRPVEGDKLESLNTWSHTLRGRVGDEPVSLSTRGGQRLVIEMARVEDGRLTRKIVKAVDSYVETQDTRTLKYIRKDDAVHGRTVTIERRGAGETHAGADGVPEWELKALALVDPLSRLFPDKPVAVGDTWDIAGEGLKVFYPGGDFTDGRIVVSLRDVQEINGRRCALLGTNFEVRGQTPDGVTRELNLKGTVTVWIERGYVLAMAQSGRLKTSGADAKSGQPNGEAAIVGELKVTVLEK